MTYALSVFLLIIWCILATNKGMLELGDYGNELDASTRNTYNRLIELETIDEYHRNHRKYVDRSEIIGLDDTFVMYKEQAIDSLLVDVSRGDTPRYKGAFDYLMEQTSFSIDVIFKLHRLISGDSANSGVYRNSNIALSLNYEKIPSAMDKLVDQVNHELLGTPNIDVWSKVAWLHYRLNIIHPLDSYHSSITSLLVNWFVLKAFNLPFPINLFSSSNVIQKQTLALKYKDCSLLAKLYLETINWNYDTVYRSYHLRAGIADPLDRGEEDNYGELVMYTGIQDFQKGVTARDYIVDGSSDIAPSDNSPADSYVNLNPSAPIGCVLDIVCNTYSPSYIFSK